MFRLSVSALLQGALVLGLAVWAWRTRQRHQPNWVRELADALGAQLPAPNRIEGERGGLRYTIQAIRAPQSSAYPLWEVTLYGLSGPPFALRVEAASDRLAKRLGLVEEKALDDAALDQRVFVAGEGTEALKPLFRHPPVSEALRALWPATEKRSQGYIWWLQSGDDWVAILNLGGVQGWLTRLPELMDRAIALARAVHASPVRPVGGRPIPRAVLGTPKWFGPVALLGGALTPVGLGINAAAAAATTSALAMSWALAGGLFGAGVVAGLVRVVLVRKTPLIEQRWVEPVVLGLLGVGLGCALNVPVNLLRQESPRTETVEVTQSMEGSGGVVDVWSIHLEGIGRIALPFDEAERFKKGDRVEVTWTSGALGLTRVLAIGPAGAGKVP